MKFSVFTHVEHFEKTPGQFFAYAPYVREMNLWFKKVEEVEIIAPARQPPKGETKFTGLFYQHSKITFTKVSSFDLLNSKRAVKAVYRIPLIIFKILGAMRRADHLHLRCPGNIGLLACFCQIFFPSKPKTAKYAGNWDPEAKQPWSYNLQKWILSNTFLTRNMIVLVYGNWSNRSKNIFPIFTASFSENHKGIIKKEMQPPYQFLFVGNLVPGKQPWFAMQVVDYLSKRNIPTELHIYGDGELMTSLEAQSKNKSYIHLNGNKPLEELREVYKNAHFLILASRSEGWPKAVAEAMFFGCIPIATTVSCVPWMLGAPPLHSCRERKGEIPNVTVTKRGILISNLDIKEAAIVDRGKGAVNYDKVLGGTVERIIELINEPEKISRMSMEAQEWSQEYTLEEFEEAINKILKFDRDVKNSLTREKVKETRKR